MKHTVMVGKPIKKGDKIVGYKDVTEIASNQAFGYNRNGFVTLQPADLDALKLKTKRAGTKAEKTDDVGQNKASKNKASKNKAGKD